MSTGATRELMERMKTDQAFRERVLAEQGPEARLALIQAEGYACSAEDVASFDAALADQDLEHVAAADGTPCLFLGCGMHSPWCPMAT